MCDDPFNYVNVFNTIEDYDNLIYLCKHRLLEAIDLHIDAYNSDKIDKHIISYTYELVISDIKPLMHDYVSILSKTPAYSSNHIKLLEKHSIINNSIYDCITHTLTAIYSSRLRIPRQYDDEFNILTHVNVSLDENAERKKVICDKIQYLQSIPQPEQRTPEWYAFRHDCITASNAWKIVDTIKQQESFIKSKINYNNNHTVLGTNIESAFHHGHKYEPLSTMLYEHVNRTKVGEFGCIKHKDYDFIGASPDGINIDPDSDKYGTLLEIKNVVSREITSIPKKEYWVQMQMQMEVCDLDYCDFLETKFVQYLSDDEFLTDYSKDNTMNNENNKTNVSMNNNGNYIGLIVMFYVNNNPVYEYCPLSLNTPDKIFEWKDGIIDKYLKEINNSSWVDNIFWRCERYSCICVERNRGWFNSALPAFKQIWNVIQTRRTEQTQATEVESITDGNDKKKKIRKQKDASDMLNGKMGICLIKLS